MGWTSRNVGVSVLLAMEEHRRQAGRRLAALREARGLTQRELSDLAGPSEKTISRFENGKHDGRRDTVRALAKALDVDESDILGVPPAPLGLDDNGQLDRIERSLAALHVKLDALTGTAPGEDLAAVLLEGAREREQQQHDTARSDPAPRQAKAT